jgi:antitoxin Phd
MVRQYSISDARNNLPNIVKQVEHGPAVELTRRGRPVAVLISHREYERLNPPKPDLWTAIQEWRATHEPFTDAEVDEVFGDIRDRSPGRDFRFDE